MLPVDEFNDVGIMRRVVFKVELLGVQYYYCPFFGSFEEFQVGFLDAGQIVGFHAGFHISSPFLDMLDQLRYRSV